MTKKKKLVLGTATVLILFAVTAVLVAQKQGPDVETAKIKEREILQTTLSNGHFAAASEMKIIARDPVIIEDILVQAGDTVKRGQVLAAVDTSSLQNEKQAVQAELAAINAQLAILDANLPLQKTQAESQQAAAQEALKLAERETSAMEELYKAGAAAEMDWRKAQGALATSQAQAQTAAAQIAQVQSQQELIKQHREQQQALNNRLHSLGERLRYYQMKAPQNGQITEVYVDAGTAAATGTPLFLITTSDLIIKSEVLAQDAPKLALGQKAVISGEVLDGKKLTGTLTHIHPQAKEKLSELGVLQHRVPVEVTLDKNPVNMRPGYPAELEIVTAKTFGLALPREAMFTLDGKNKVFAIKNNRAVITQVDTGFEGKDYVEILAGLEAGSTVIMNPAKEVTDKARVKQK